jgi:hypothetical protein
MNWAFRQELHEECVLGPVNQFLRPFDWAIWE